MSKVGSYLEDRPAIILVEIGSPGLPEIMARHLLVSGLKESSELLAQILLTCIEQD